MREEPANGSGERETLPDLDDEPKLLGRAGTLRLGAAAVAAATASTATRAETSAASPEHENVRFDRVLDAVSDLGVDPTGGEAVDGRLQNALETGTIVEFPAGEYRVTSALSLPDRTGIVGTDDRSNVRFVVENEGSDGWIDVDADATAVVKRCTVRGAGRTGAGNGGSTTGTLRSNGVEYAG